MTIPQMIRDRRIRWERRRCMMVKEGGAYRDILWDEFYGAVEKTALGLIQRGLKPGDKAAILSHTRYEWAVADAAVLSAAGITVPVYPTLTQREVLDLLRRSDARVLFVSDRELSERCLPFLDQPDGIDLLVAFEPEALAGVTHPRAITLRDLQQADGQQDPAVLAERISAGADEDVATVIFTSGTTGEPKGVVLTHRNILSNVEAALSVFDIGPADLCLSHLPLAHILERMAGYYVMLWCGATIAYAEGIQQVAQNISEVRPTVAISVPRIFEKIYAGIQTKAVESPTPVRALTFWALRVATLTGELRAAGRPVPPGLGLQFWLADRLVYAKIRKKLGGRLRFFISGGAPLAPDLSKFFISIGVQIYEGYGLTETSPVTNANTPALRRIGTVGTFLPGVSGKIADDGEILIKGPNVFGGYYKDPKATKEAFTDDGWFKTGDIGEIDSDGFLIITDRKKDLIVTAGGKNVAPQKVENVLKLDRYIADVLLFGDRKPFVTALIVPDFQWLSRYATWKDLHETAPADLVRHPRVLDFYERRIAKIQEAAHLSPFETVKKFVLLDHEFSMAEGEVTPTMKIRRKVITDRYRDVLEALYEQG